MKKFYILILFMISINLFSQDVEEDWVNFYNPHLARGSETLVMDNSEEFVYFAGGTDNALITMKIDSEGELVWEEEYFFPGSGYTQACEIKIDQYNNIYVTGYCDNWNLSTTEYIVIKYDQYGNELWATVCDYVGYMPNSIVWLDIDEQQNVYIASRFATGSTISNFITIKYDIDGQELWHEIHDGAYGGDDVPSDILVDGAGNVFVLGLSEMAYEDYDFSLIKYNSIGELQWEERYSAHCEYSYLYPRMALDESENICLIGMDAVEPDDYDFVIMKFDQDGNILWSHSYSGTYQNSWDHPEDLAIDEEGNIHILGSIQNEYSYTDMAILKYSLNGDLIWEEIYSSDYGSVNDYAAAITLDIYNYVYIAGMMEYCFNTIKYSSEGESLWEIYWDEPELRYDAYLSDVLVNSSGDVYVLGYNNYTNTTLIKYVQPNFTDVNNDIVPEVQFALRNYPNPFNPSTTISFELNSENTDNIELIIYNLKGQKIKTFNVTQSGVEGQSSITWNGNDKNNQPVSSGIYYSVIKEDSKILASRKMLLMK